jgi:PAS domain S-box-containing protein
VHKRPGQETPPSTERESSIRAREVLAGERERAANARDATLTTREEVASLRDEISSLRDQAFHARAEADAVRAEREQLLTQMRQANEQLVLATDRAETLALETESARQIAADSEERFRTLVMTAATIVWRADAEGNIQVDLDSWRAFVGEDAAAAIRDDGWIEAVHSEDRNRVRETWRTATRTTSPYTCEHRLRKHDGSYAHVVSRAVPILRTGAVREWIGMMTDVTAKVKLDEAREQFIAILGHDLRNPLGAILMGVETLESLGDPHARAVATIGRAARRIEAMIRDLMDFARGRLGGGIPATLKPCHLGTLCADAVAEMQQAFPARTIVATASGNLDGEWDPDRVEQVVSNLVGNAIAHGEDPIIVDVRDEGDEVVMSVHNRGEPIPRASLPTLFEPFAHGARGGARNRSGVEGLGLGLYIVREIVRAHGGTIAVTSTRSDGTAFTIRWPRSPAVLERIGPRALGPLVSKP